ncbi:beta-glucosidase [Alicyclobacillus curvatus]|nr:beta-glucosidase [Alicyclobacillus curvatus]
MTSNLSFPDGFLWGAATAAYQIEGAVHEGGRGVSVWDTFSHTPGKVNAGETGDVACDHYHRYDEDLDILQSLGVKSYRFSVAWPRIFPERGKLEQQGIDFYRKLVEGLLERGITPALTLYHWDLPQYLEDDGGWANRATVDAFVEYAETLFREFGDLVPYWITHNEPWCTAFLGYGLGIHAPGHQDWTLAARASHHVLLSHGLAVQAYRKLGLTGQIGITLNFMHVEAEGESPDDLRALDIADAFSNRWFLDPLFKSSYPEVLKNTTLSGVPDWSFIQPGDLEVISVPIDFLGVNYYTRGVMKFDGTSPQGVVQLPPTLPTTESGWEIYPDGLYHLLTRLRSDYTGGLPLYITENGAAFIDDFDDGEVHDSKRIDYIYRHLQAARKFIEEGGALKGYYVWSLMDNFEWAEGYAKRFGIVYVDYKTQKRTLKDSAKWYRDVITANALLDSATV